MSIQLRGTTIVQQSHSETVLTPGSLAFYDTARPYQLTSTADFEQIILHLPHRVIEPAVPGGLSGVAKRLSASDPCARAIFALAAPLASLANSKRTVACNRTSIAAESLFLLALSSIVSRRSRLGMAGPTFLLAASDVLASRARTLIESQLHDCELTPMRVAGQMHVSLRRLQEIFQSQRTTLHETIWDMRLELARDLLICAGHGPELTGTIAYRLPMRLSGSCAFQSQIQATLRRGTARMPVTAHRAGRRRRDRGCQ